MTNAKSQHVACLIDEIGIACLLLATANTFNVATNVT